MSFMKTAMQNRSLLSIVQKSKGTLHAVISVFFMVSILLTAEVWGATPVGTIITNTTAAADKMIRTAVFFSFLRLVPKIAFNLKLPVACEKLYDYSS